MPATVTVTAPSRLHFGLLGFGDASERQFGGVGVMIEQPALQLRISRADQLSIHGFANERVRGFVQHWSSFHQLNHPPAIRIDVLHATRSHIGLGSGTQLGLAVAAGLNRLFDREASVIETARSAGRGLRSAVGTYGFFQGGLIWERGKTNRETISPLEQRVAIPDAWRFVVICPKQQVGLSGEGERTAMACLPPVPVATQDRLSAIVEDRMLPAVAVQSCDEFGEAVFEYGRMSGQAFAPIQGGAFNGARLEHLVERVRSIGGVGVGQSSWGPALYVIVPCETTSQTIIDQLRDSGDLDDADIWISGPDNRGARIATEA
jgi:beta-RFAP synthase